MSTGTDAGQGRVADGDTPVEKIRALGRAEREAISANDWDGLEQILEQQKALWSQLLDDARRDDTSAECREAREALNALYEIRRRNHALIERSFGELRRRLTTAHTGSGAKSAYYRTSGRAA